MDAKMVYLYCMGTCLIITILYNVILKFFAKALVWLTILITGAGLIAGCYYGTLYHKDNYDPGPINKDGIQ